ncbi:hypothetical protein [Sphingomonas sp.]|jgi:hypothetical protein|uniref:hypothetical protein n=1 Tax=Sphingomonas sp. TaxID=28214 RepID=UPI002EDB1278
MIVVAASVLMAMSPGPFALMAAPSLVVGQDKRGTKSSKLSEANEHRKILRAYALCVADSDPNDMTDRAVRAVMENGAMSRKAKDGAAVLAKSWCPTIMVGHNEKFGWLSYPAEALRGQLFRARYLLKMAGKPIGPPLESTEPAWRLPADDSYRPAQIFGECIVRKAPELSRTAISGKIVATPEESESYAALKPTIAACVPGGVTLTLTRAFLEATIAEALFHFATVTPTVVSHDANIRSAQ